MVLEQLVDDLLGLAQSAMLPIAASHDCLDCSCVQTTDGLARYPKNSSDTVHGDSFDVE